jgi:CubicO group peptidase (beta-lactamase class C family)
LSGGAVGLNLDRVSKLDALVESWLSAFRIPGACLAVVAGEDVVFARGFGYRDLDARLAMTADTVYPIASTSKAINATLIGTLVDEGKLAWDTPVQEYLPRFRLGDSAFSSQVTIRDLLTMRTGLAAHDWLWIGNPLSRPELVNRMAHLAMARGFRERFDYNNLTPIAAGHIAEVVAGESWETLVARRFLEPLEMRQTGFTRAASGEVTESYHENECRERVRTVRLPTDTVAPAGGAVHSTIVDMSRWVLFNLRGPAGADEPVPVSVRTLAELHTPQVVGGGSSAAPSPNASYALGWWVDTYKGVHRVSHTGYIHDVSSSVMFFPSEGVGFVSFTNFGSARPARLINEHAFDVLMGSKPAQSLQEKMGSYEQGVAENQARLAKLQRVAGTRPSHEVSEYAGTYSHPGYGFVRIECAGAALVFHRGVMSIPLRHWHFDAWAFEDAGLFDAHQPHALDRAGRVLFDTDAQGTVAGLTMPLEPAVAPIRFIRARS